jgi:hypothetical protein
MGPPDITGLDQRAGMPEPKGRSLPLSVPRRFMGDLVHFARRAPLVPVSRMMDLGPLVKPRLAHPARPSWAVVMMKAYGIVAADHAPLRRALLTFPRTRLYEHPSSTCALAFERHYEGEDGIFVGLFRAPECQTLTSLQEALEFYKNEPLNLVGFFRQQIRVSRAPRPLRRLLWWSTLDISGVKRSKHFGTFGLTTYGSLGAEQLHPISPLTTTLTYGKIEPSGRVCVKLIYDHRVLDGAFVARRLNDVEAVLHGPIVDELRDIGAAQRVPSLLPGPRVSALRAPA